MIMGNYKAEDIVLPFFLILKAAAPFSMDHEISTKKQGICFPLFSENVSNLFRLQGPA
jgi:hypothetical protein